MNVKKWEYKGVYHRVNMEGIINLPNDSKLMVNDLTNGIPDFMLDADTLFIDPPCNKGNLRSFYTKSDKDLVFDFDFFEFKLFEAIKKINPKVLFIEVFKSNRDRFKSKCEELFKTVIQYDSFYYNNRKNKCWILHCSDEKDFEGYKELQDIDEEKAIAWICKNHKYNCIGDLCMGKGLVGKNAYLQKKKFVGTELNKKRLAILVDYIKNGTKWTQR